jgi:hypothetical protein
VILSDAYDEMDRLSKLLEDGLAYLKRQVNEFAVAEKEYRETRAEAWVRAKAALGEKALAKELEDAVNSISAGARQRRDIADGMRGAGLEAVRSRRAQISALQSLLAAHKAEAEFARTGPS